MHENEQPSAIILKQVAKRCRSHRQVVKSHSTMLLMLVLLLLLLCLMLILSVLLRQKLLVLLMLMFFCVVDAHVVGVVDANVLFSFVSDHFEQ